LRPRRRCRRGERRGVQQHYQNIVSALARTIELMEAIDKSINTHVGWPLQ
jgi:hypothetical protein